MTYNLKRNETLSITAYEQVCTVTEAVREAQTPKTEGAIYSVYVVYLYSHLHSRGVEAKLEAACSQLFTTSKDHSLHSSFNDSF